MESPALYKHFDKQTNFGSKLKINKYIFMISPFLVIFLFWNKKTHHLSFIKISLSPKSFFGGQKKERSIIHKSHISLSNWCFSLCYLFSSSLPRIFDSNDGIKITKGSILCLEAVISPPVTSDFRRRLAVSSEWKSKQIRLFFKAGIWSLLSPRKQGKFLALNYSIK
jgi:hypothetical protein